jgi:hypothetical protein
MLIRVYRDSDLAAVRAIHATQGFDYALPDLSNPLFVTRLVLTNDDSRVAAQHAAPGEITGLHVTASTKGSDLIGAAFLRLTAEAYLLLDPRAGSPRQRWQWLLALHDAAKRDAWQRGLEDVHAWLPPRIAKKFGRRLARLGWQRDDTWTPYCKRLAAGN